MATKRYLNIISGILQQVIATVVSSGVSNAGDIVALDDTGKLDMTLMPSGVGANTGTATASEAIGARDLVNVYDDDGTTKVRKADASVSGKEANGFCPSAFAESATATIYYGGQITGLTGLTAGEYYLSDDTPGGITLTPPSDAGHIVQAIGNAVSATALNFEPDRPVLLA